MLFFFLSKRIHFVAEKKVSQMEKKKIVEIKIKNNYRSKTEYDKPNPARSKGACWLI